HIVSRDADYGIILEDKSYLNDHLRQEFKERVSKKRNIFLHKTLSEALKQFAVTVSREEEKEESEILQINPTVPPPLTEESIQQLRDLLQKVSANSTSSASATVRLSATDQ